jgi:hypothetical protein
MRCKQPTDEQEGPMCMECRIQTLAEKVVESWDMDTLVQYAIDQLVAFYHRDQEKYNEDLEAMFGENETG